MREFVKHGIERVGALAGQIKGDEILITPAQEKRRQVRRLPLVQAQKRLHGLVIGKRYHDDWWGGYCLGAGQERISLSKLFQSRPNFRHLLIGTAAVDIEMRRASFKPMVLQEWGEFGL